MEFFRLNNQSKSYYFLFIPLAVYIIKVLEALFQFAKDFVTKNGYTFLQNVVFITLPDNNGHWFMSDFIQSSGILYGVLLPLVLIRAWEQLDDIDRLFEQEANAVKALYHEISFLQNNNKELKGKISGLLHNYVQNILEMFSEESKNHNNNIATPIKEIITGNQILDQIRKELKSLFLANGTKTKASETLISELVDRLNAISTFRGDRIAYSSQTLFEVLRFATLLTSIVFVLPYYYVSVGPKTGLLDELLITGVTLFVIFIYIIIEDLDDPIGGVWGVSDESWKRVLDEMDSDKNK